MDEELIEEENIAEDINFKALIQKIRDFWSLHDDGFTVEDVRNYFTLDELKSIIYKGHNGNSYNIMTFLFRDVLIDLKKLFTDDELIALMEERPDQIYELTKFASEDILIGLVEANPKDSSITESVSDQLTNDAARLKALKFVKKQDVMMPLIVSLDDDLIKVRLLSKIRDKTCRNEIIGSIKNEYIKERFISPINPNVSAIASISDDLRKVYYLRKYGIRLDEYDKGRIISTLKNPDLIYNLLKIYGDKVRARAISCLDKKVSEEYMDKYINLINNEKYLCLILLGMQEKYVIKYANRLKDKSLISLIKNGYYPKSKFNVVHELLKNIKEDYKFIETFNQIEKVPLYKDEYIDIVERFSEYYNIDFDRLLLMVKNTSLDLLKQVNNKNIMNILQSDEDTFNKLMGLFDKKELEMTKKTMNDILYAFLQKKYRKENNEILLTLNNILNAIKAKNKDYIINKLNEIKEDIDINKYINGSIDSFVELLLKKDEDSLDTLDKIVDEYKNFKKNQYILNNKDDTERECVKNLVDDTTVRSIIKEYPLNFIINLVKRGIHFFEPKNDKQRYLIKHFEIIEKTIKYFKDPKKYGKMPDDVKEHILTFYEVVIPTFDSDEYKEAKVKQEYQDVDSLFMVRVLSRIDINKLASTVFNDPELFNELKRYINAYKLCGWGSTFDKLITEAGLIFDDEVMACFIQYFGLSYNELKEKVENKTLDNISLTSLLDSSFCYSTASKRYSLLFGIEDYKYIVTDPGAMSSTLDKKVRINKALEYVKKMRSRKYVTVPPVDKVFTLKNGKSINIVVGNVSNMINLTYGERTNACMRIGGVGKELFRFCIEDENGFHIRFVNPRNNKFVTRVSCFRNGNTVFLNQLRDTVDREYDDDDIIEAAKLIAKELIELSKDSPNPIENVVVTPAYTMQSSGMTPVDLEVSSVDQGLKHIYNDYGDSGIVLASTNGRHLVPIKLGNKGLYRYPVQRDKKRVLYDRECREYIAHLKALDEHMNGTQVDDINIELDKTKVMCYCGEDWYVALDEKGNVESFVMKSSVNPDLAKEEMKEALESIKQKIPQELANSRTL